ncbi:MAG: hypothetical protein FJX90_04630 [Bacteroidetes bacterium]|nr:hypothetical protein [Bacteroidota bacterium]
MKKKTVEAILNEGCGRCEHEGTPACRMLIWKNELAVLRKIALSSGLEEHVKWGVPTYTYQNKNIAILHAFKEMCGLSFFKGSLLDGKSEVLVQPTENSQGSRQTRFTSVAQIQEHEAELKMLLFEAIELEKAGAKVSFKKTEEYDIPEELEQIFKAEPAFKEAFEKLTPGRQKGYLLHFAQAKQSKTRTERILKYMQHIFEGKGMHDEYRARKKS